MATESSGPRIDKMTITYARPGVVRRRRQEEDKKVIKGVMHVCRHVQVTEMGQKMYLMNRGRPVLEWVPIEDDKK